MRLLKKNILLHKEDLSNYKNYFSENLRVQYIMKLSFEVTII